MSREESFTAWRRFLESIASVRPAVLVVEDIHWADEALLAFLEHLAGWSHGLPLLVVCTARPELFDTHPSWAAGIRNSVTIALGGLSDADTAALVGSLLGRRLLPAQTQRLVLDRAEGNPLYAEECVRVLVERDLLDEAGGLRRDDVPFPQGIQALIAARLDTLTPHRKALLADAAVIGRVFWAGALIAMGNRDPAEVTTALHELTGKEFIRPARESSLAGQTELSFWHALVRDVAYNTIPRPTRAAKHLAVARWLEEGAAGRVSDLAEILAHHSGEALTLAKAAGDATVTDQVTPLARRHALLAAEKVLGLDSEQAMQLFDRVLELTAADDPDRPRMMVLWAEAADQFGRLRQGADALAAAASMFRDRGDVIAAGAALAKLSEIQQHFGTGEFVATAKEAVRLLEEQPPGPELVEAYSLLASAHLLMGSHKEVISVANQALTLADQVNCSAAAAVGYRGYGRVLAGEAAGISDLEHGLSMLIETDRGHLAAINYNNLGIVRWLVHGPQAALATIDEGAAFARARGFGFAAARMRGSRLQPLLETGRLSEVVKQAQDILDQDVAEDFAPEVVAAKVAALIELGIAPVEDEADSAVDVARRSGRPDMLCLAVASAAQSGLVTGDFSAAKALLNELTSTPTFSDNLDYFPRLPGLVRCAIGIGDLALVHQLIEPVTATLPIAEHALVTSHALLAQATEDHPTAISAFTDAAARWAACGNRLEQAYALLGLGRSLLARAMPAEAPLRDARELFVTMGARRRVNDCDTLLARCSQSTA